MEQVVTCCGDCPLFDDNGAEYGTYCHHPKRMFIVERSVSGDVEKDGSCVKQVEVKPEEYEYWDTEAKRLSLLPNEEVEKMPWQSIRIINEPIQNDENYNPITPDWCPLNKEPITITKNN
jgi:hypothetical protein